MFPTMVGFMMGTITQMRSQLAGAMRVSGTLAINLPSLDARIKAVGNVAAQLALAKPGVKFNIAANANLIATLKIQLGIIADLQAALGAAGIDAYLYDGPAQTFGTEVQSALGGGLPGGSPSEHVDAFVLATRYPTTFSAMGKVMFR